MQSGAKDLETHYHFVQQERCMVCVHSEALEYLRLVVSVARNDAIQRMSGVPSCIYDLLVDLVVYVTSWSGIHKP